MKYYSVLFLTILLITACSSTPENQIVQVNSEPDNMIYGIDSLVGSIAERTVSLLSGDVSRTIAVYYFTVNGQESNISDYLITGLTTEIANLSGNETTVVSRQGLDRVMSEQSLMVSDLVSEETQVNIGALLGADVILIGYIVPLDDFDKINIQIIEVESGAVIGGFFLDYKLEDGFIRDTANETIVIDGGAVQVEGITTVKTIYENFNGSVVSLSPSHYEEYWGDRIQYASAKTGTSDEGYGYLQFEAEFDTIDIMKDWEDSDLNFYLIFRTDWKSENQDGISFGVFPEGFSQLSAFIQQTDSAGEQITRMAPMSLNPDKWTEMQIPFSSFMDISEGDEIDFSKPITIGFAVPYLDNFTAGHFRDSTFLNSRLRVDNLGLFKLNEPDPPGLIEAYQDDVTRAPAVFRVGGSYLYVDYSESDAGVKKRNDGVESESLRTSLIEDGPGGRFLRLSGELKVNNNIQDFLETEEDLYVIYSLTSGVDWKDFESFSMLIRSDTFEACYMEIAGLDNGEYYSADFSLNSSWTQINKPFSSTSKSTRIQFIFAIPRSSIQRSLRKDGILSFFVDLDQIMLQ